MRIVSGSSYRHFPRSKQSSPLPTISSSSPFSKTVHLTSETCWSFLSVIRTSRPRYFQNILAPDLKNSKIIHGPLCARDHASALYIMILSSRASDLCVPKTLRRTLIDNISQHFFSFIRIFRSTNGSENIEDW